MEDTKLPIRKAAKFAIFSGVIVATVIFACVLLWQIGIWPPFGSQVVSAFLAYRIEPENIRAILLTLIQTQAGILAIAVSFSLLFVQVSVEAYSLRASRLLIQHPPFIELVKVYIFSLVVLSLLILSLQEDIQPLPLFFGIAGFCLFFYGLYFLVIYIADVTHFITPEAIVNFLSQKFTRAKIEQEAQKLIDRRKRENESYRARNVAEMQDVDLYNQSRNHRFGIDSYSGLIQVPMGITVRSNVDEDFRVLIDFTKRMIISGDHVAVKAGIDRIPSFQIGYSYWHLTDLGEEQKLAEYQRIHELEAAQIAFLCGALMELWTTAFRIKDILVADLLIREISSLVGNQILEQRVLNSNLLEVVVRDKLFFDATNLEWFQLRNQIIKIITENLGVIDQSNYQYRHHGAQRVVNILINMAVFVFDEEQFSQSADYHLFKGISMIARYGATAGEGGVIGDVSRYLGRRANKLKQVDKDELSFTHRNEMVELIRDMRSRLIEKATEGKFDFKDLWYISSYSVPNLESQYDDLKPWTLEDDLIDVAMECINRGKWDTFLEIISAIPTKNINKQTKQKILEGLQKIKKHFSYETIYDHGEEINLIDKLINEVLNDENQLGKD